MSQNNFNPRQAVKAFTGREDKELVDSLEKLHESNIKNESLKQSIAEKKEAIVKNKIVTK